MPKKDDQQRDNVKIYELNGAAKSRPVSFGRLFYSEPIGMIVPARVPAGVKCRSSCVTLAIDVVDRKRRHIHKA